MNYNFNKKSYNKKKGVVLIITLAIVTIILSLSLGIISIATKQQVLSSLGSESQKAFFAADTGIECVLYWELQTTDSFMFATSSDSLMSAPVGDICAGQDLSPDPDNWYDWNIDSSPTSATTTFTVSAWSDDYGDALDINNPCVVVTIYKNGPDTEVLSSGYNTCDINAGRRISRAVHINY